MFGYVKLYKPELKIKDYEAYKAVYCTLCKTLGKEYGVGTRMFLSYDLTFYVLFRKALLNKQNDCYVQGRCRFNPTKKCNYVSEIDEIFKTAAALTILLTYFKIKDDLHDGGFFKKIACCLIYPYILMKYKKAKKQYLELENIVSTCMQMQNEVEKAKTRSIDKAAEPSAIALSKLFSYGISDDKTYRITERFGYCLGRWVYLADAYDDIHKDLKSKNYNPYIIKYNINAEPFDVTAMQKDLRLSANEAALAFNLLDLNQQYNDILSNIVYDGLEAQQELITKKRGIASHE